MKYSLLVKFFVSVLVLSSINSCNVDESKNEVVLFVGTYTDNGSEGIYSYNFNLDSGKLDNKKLAATMKNPSYLAFSSDKKSLYVVGEIDNFKKDDGCITTFRVKDTALTKIDTQSTYGANPCFVEVSDDGSKVAVANYTGGNIAIYNTRESGNLMVSPQIIDHKVIDTTRASHAHMSSFLNGELLVSDLGLDRIRRYSDINGQFVSSEQEELTVAEGAGPRHFVSLKNGKYLYVINELNSTITLFQKEDDKYYGIETYATLESGYVRENFCADIHLSPDGKFLYGTNRGENTIVIFKVDKTNGKLNLIGRESVKGDWPRNFSIDPTGKYVLVANQRSNNIVVFNRDTEKGTLIFASEVELPSPVCLKFY